MLARGRAFRRRIAAARPEQGAAAVEFALILPVLVMLLLGITTAGLSYTRAIGLTNAVREGTRFGATADAFTDPVAWATDVANRVRATQFDDDTNAAQSATSVCVQLWKKTGASTGLQKAGGCSNGKPGGSPAMDMLTVVFPDVPANLPTNGCIVRIVSARNFTINIGLAKWDRTNVAGSVARYERMDMVKDCV